MRILMMAAIGAATGSACLDAREGRRAGGDVESDVRADVVTTTSTRPDTSVGSDVGPSDCGSVAVDPPVCDDGDPCTVDTYFGEIDPCGQTTAFCQHAPIPGCGSIAGECAENGALQFHELVNLPAGRSVRAVVQVRIGNELDCLDDECTCTGGAALYCLAAPEYVEGACGARLPITTVEGEAAECRTERCAESRVAWCQPMHDDVDYIVWGTTLPAGAGTVPAGEVPIVPPQGTGSFQVDGYCLRTDLGSLLGQYEGRLVVDGEEIHFRGEMGLDEPGWNYLQVHEASCENCPNWGALLSQDVIITLPPGDGYVDVADIWSGSESLLTEVSGRLFSNHNSLAGTVTLGDGDESVTGQLELTRLAPAGPRP